VQWVAYLVFLISGLVPGSPSRRPPAAGPGRDSGMTLIELIVAMTVILIGMLSVASMMAAANLMSVATRGREAATGVQRELVERARSIPYAQLNQASVYQELQALPGLEDYSASSGYQLRRRGFTYTATVTVCSVDDPKDGYGAHAAGMFCAGGSTGTQDANPDDYKVVTTDLSWAQGRTHPHTRQQTLVNSGGSNVGPPVCGISLDGSTNTVITSVVSSLTLGICVNFTPSTVSVSVDGETQGSATGTGLNWSYIWSIDALVDGNYLVAARAFDSQGRPGPERSVTVTLNRRAPLAPTGLAAGRNGSVVDAEWLANKERDIVGYRLYRGTTMVASCSAVSRTDCQDTAPGTDPSLTYTLKALDHDPAGNLREGPPSDQVTVTTLNHAPNAPTGLSVATNGQGDTVLNWSAPAIADPDLGDSIAFYRIYRDGTTVADRFDRTGSGSDHTWTDARSAGQSHTYRVTAVDTQLAESAFVGPVSS
jgi:prepilin-type N-terminal cleavage/methylation domain-containing protein